MLKSNFLGVEGNESLDVKEILLFGVQGIVAKGLLDLPKVHPT
jgi:hypothetical protein